MLKSKLEEFYTSAGPERVGFIFSDDTIVEVENVAARPEDSFDVSAEDLIAYGERATATFHTHPGVISNLSNDDYSAFLSWPKLRHYIIGSDGIRCYKVMNNTVILDHGSP